MAPVPGKLVAPATIRDAMNFFDVNLMGDLTPAVRLGIEFAYYADRYMDGDDRAEPARAGLRLLHVLGRIRGLRADASSRGARPRRAP